MKRSAILATVGAAAAVLAIAVPAQATTYGVSVYEASGAGAFNAVDSSNATLQARPDVSHATFTYAGPIAFTSTAGQNSSNTGDLSSSFFGSYAAGISNYSGTGPASVVYGANGANYGTLAGFLATSGSASGFAWGSLYTFTSEAGSYGGTDLTISHDDGVSVYVNGSAAPLSGTTSTPTTVLTETVRLPVGTTVYRIVYGRENGTPSVLQVAVPEPMTVALLGSGLVGLGLVVRRRRQGTSGGMAGGAFA